MNDLLIQAGLKLFLAALDFMQRVKSDDAALQAIVDQARAEGRSVDLADVKASVNRMTGEGESLRDMIAAKKDKPA